MSTTRSRGASGPLRVLALLVGLGLLIAACGNSGDGDTGTAGDDDGGGAPSTEGVPGVTDDEIHFAALGVSTAANPIGNCTLECYVAGIEAYFAYRNSEGGVHGRELKVTRVVDDELMNNQVKALEILEADDTFGIFAVPLMPTGFADIAEVGVPLYTTVISSAETAGQESSYAVPGGVNCIECSQKSNAWIAGQVGASTVGVLGQGISQASKDCVAGAAASIEKYGADVGAEVGYTNDDLPYGLPNGIAPEVTAMREAGVDLVLTCIGQNDAETLRQEMARQGMEATVMLPGDGYGSPPFIEEFGELFEGDLMTVTYTPFEADIEGTGVETFLEWMDETGADEGTDLGYAMFGWLAADMAYTGIEAAGPEFDRQAVVEATNQIDGHTADGAMPPVDWTRQHELPSEDDPAAHGPDPRCLAVVRIVDGGYELLSDDPAKPWACWDAAEEGYQDPTFMGFD